MSTSRTETIAALFVDARGAYSKIDGIDCWDEERDARKYAGPYSAVAHPPCTRWCRLAGLVEARWGHKRGEDGGCFKSALQSVRKWGGVLEHPAYSDAWKAFGLNRPPTGGGWVNADWRGGWTCYVEQGRYGHQAKKETWLYACGVDLPTLRWGHARGLGEVVSNLGKRSRDATPVEFRDELIRIARSRL